MEKQLVVFELAGEHFGIDIAAVEGIVKLQEISKIPQAPDYIDGVTNLRGSILPVVDLEKCFGIEPHPRTRETRIVVVNMGAVKIGMIVAGVSEVLTIDESVIEPPPPMISTVNTQFIIGIAKIDARLVILLDLARVLTIEEKQQAALLSV